MNQKLFLIILTMLLNLFGRLYRHRFLRLHGLSQRQRPQPYRATMPSHLGFPNSLTHLEKSHIYLYLFIPASRESRRDFS